MNIKNDANPKAPPLPNESKYCITLKMTCLDVFRNRGDTNRRDTNRGDTNRGEYE